MNDVPKIFDARLRRQRRRRAVKRFDAFAFLSDLVAAELAERLHEIGFSGRRGVASGPRAPSLAGVDWIHGDVEPGFVPENGLVFDEEWLPFRPSSLDLYASVLTLHAVNDLPGALTQIRRSLKPGGVFVAGLLGGETLHELKMALNLAELEVEGGMSPRVAPFVDVRDAGALLQRAGFDLPVADIDTHVVRYERPLKLFADLRGMGESNVLVERRRRFLKRSTLLRALALYLEQHKGEDNRVPATFQILYLSGKAPER